MGILRVARNDACPLRDTILSLLMFNTLPFLASAISSSAIPCTSTLDCQTRVHPASECQRLLFPSNDTSSPAPSYCSNPYQLGCLHRHASMEGAKIRVCNSEDPPEASSQGLCRIPPVEYPEIRIYTQNWESAMFSSWILQIALSELLDVPVTLETGLPDAKLNFYDPWNAFDYGLSVDLQALQSFVDHGFDCRALQNQQQQSASPGLGSQSNSYIPCAQMIPEIWDSLSQSKLRDMVQLGTLDPPSMLGVLGQEAWFVPKFTAERDPAILNYLGLQGETNRAKLADMFLLPTSWKEYCETVSSSRCMEPGSVAQRPPNDKTENEMMFVAGLFTGYFRKPLENECNVSSTATSNVSSAALWTNGTLETSSSGKCTGVLIDYPCGWGSNSEAQAYWLDIALRPYLTFTYEQMTQIWRAANHTKSNVMMMWWSPEALYQEFQGTEAEFIKVTMPTPTQECLEHRIDIAARCSSDWTMRVGTPPVCDDPPKSLRKVILRVLYDLIHDAPVETRSPAYDALNLYSISELELGQMFQKWKTSRTPRDAICDWVVENLDVLHSIVPRTYPRTFQAEPSEGPLLYSSLALGGIATALVLLTSVGVYRQRHRRVMRYAQVEFLFLLLVGALTLSVGAVVVAAPPTDASCLAAIWLINLGYTLELVPLIVKVAALNRLMQAARKMRRVVLRRTALFGAVTLISALMVIFLIIWSALDPPNSLPDYTLTADQSEQNETIVSVQYYCSSNSDVWVFLSAGWNALLLLCASILAVQSRKLQQDFNESHTLAILIYSHFVFVMLRVITFALPLKGGVRLECQSIIFSLDTVATMVIYFVPKFWTSDDYQARTSVFYSGEFSERASLPPAHSSNDLAACVSSSKLRNTSDDDENDNDDDDTTDDNESPANCDRATSAALSVITETTAEGPHDAGDSNDSKRSSEDDAGQLRDRTSDADLGVLLPEQQDLEGLLRASRNRIELLETEIRRLDGSSPYLRAVLDLCPSRPCPSDTVDR